MTIINKYGLVNNPNVQEGDQVIIRDGGKVRVFNVVPSLPFLDLDSKLGRIIEPYLFDQKGNLTDFGKEVTKNYNFPTTITGFKDSFLVLQEVKQQGISEKGEELIREGLSGKSITYNKETGTYVQLNNGQAQAGINRTPGSPSTIIIDMSHIPENEQISFTNALNTATSQLTIDPDLVKRRMYGKSASR